MDKLRHKIYTAALLHDMGKFYQRADRYTKKSDTYFEMLEPEFRKLEPDYCPQYDNRYSHKHVLWTVQFIEKVLGISDKSLAGDKQHESLSLLAGKHHKPSTFFEKIITYADHLSSSVDRNQLTEDVKHESDWGDYKKTPLLSVFEIIGNFEKQEKNYRLPVSILDIAHIMPQKKDAGYDMEKLYSDLWEKFEEELKNIFPNPDKILQDKNTVETLYFLLQKYLVNIPSSTQDIPDISLFDHSKITAAFAISLYDYIKENGLNTLNELDYLKNSAAKPFILLGADLSGIQAYLYKVKSKYAAKNLKGRSFMLHLMMSSLSQKIIDKLGLYQSNIIYNSGGTFFMLLPHTPYVLEKMESLQEEMEKELMENFGGDLFIALSKIPFGMSEVFDKKINRIWQQVFEGLSNEKSQRFKKILSKNYSRYFEPFGDIKAPRDSITGEEITGEPVQKSGMVLSELTWKQIELGKKLKKARYWYIIKEGWSKKQSDMVFAGYHHLLLEDQDKRLDDLENVIRFKINDTSFAQAQKKAIQGFEFYGGNNYPVDEDGSPKTFDQLTLGNYNKLGIIRMDVDNLGYLFKYGFTNRQKTFSRYANLSRSLDLFFRAYINHIWSSKPEYKAHLFILYSGGDDLFILGDWKIAWQFAEELRNDFRKYVCYNPLLTLSGGELIVAAKYPILKAAESAEETEKQAKNYVYKNKYNLYRFEIDETEGNVEEIIRKLPKQKDAFALLDTALGWEAEYLPVKEMAKILLKKIEENSLPKSFLQKIMGYYNRKDELRTTWLMSYDFSRMMSRYKKEKQFIEQVLKDILNNTWQGEAKEDFVYSSFKLYAMAARLAELLYRDNN